jgi:hypothetical protein
MGAEPAVADAEKHVSSNQGRFKNQEGKICYREEPMTYKITKTMSIQDISLQTNLEPNLL